MEELRKKRKLVELRRLQLKEESLKKKEKKRKKEEYWAMSKWVHKYIEENNFKWEREKLLRLEERQKRLDDWDRNSRRRKVEILKEKFRNRGAEREEGATDHPDHVEEGWRKEKSEESEDLVTETVTVNEEDDAKEMKLNVKIREPILNKDNELYSTILDRDLVLLMEENMADYEENDLGKNLVEELVDDLVENLVAGYEKTDLGKEDFCLDCVLQPCICLLLKLELKIKAIKNGEDEDIRRKNAGKISKEVTEEGGGVFLK